MLLKRIYEHGEDDQVVMDSDGNLVLDYIRVLHAGPEQRFSTSLVDGGILEGWITLKDDTLTLLTKPRLIYKVQREPGYYCCHCGEGLPGSLEAQRHVESEHSHEELPDSNNPAGYERIHYYEGVKQVGKEKK